MGCGGLFAGLRGNPGNRENESCKVHVAGYAGDEAGTALACRLEHWFYRYRIEWDKTSRVSATPNLIRLMNAWADCLRGRAYGSVPVPEAKD